MSFFTRHLDSVDETYLQHARHALGFSVAMFLGSLACLVHALCPFLFERTGSDSIRRLHDRMVVNRLALTPEKRTKAETSRRQPVAEHA